MEASYYEAVASDSVDRILAQWQAERPDLDPSPMGVVGRIARASARLGREVDVTLADHGLTGGSFDVLAALRRAGAPHRLSPTTLYLQLMVSSGSMTARLDKLEQAGLIERLPDPADRRGVLVGLTPAGLATVDRAVESHLANEERLLAGLTAPQRERLAGLLRRLLLELGD